MIPIDDYLYAIPLIYATNLTYIQFMCVLLVEDTIYKKSNVNKEYVKISLMLRLNADSPHSYPLNFLKPRIWPLDLHPCPGNIAQN